MYESHWGLKKKPFEHDPEPGAYYPCEMHQGALLKLRYAVESRCDAALLAGPSGVGKSLLVQLLRRQVDAACAPFIHVVFPLLSPAELITWIADDLGAAGKVTHEPLDATLRRLRAFLEENIGAGRHAVIAVDESQCLEETSGFEALRLLLNLRHDGTPAATLLLVGQSSLLTLLQRQPSFEERLGVKCVLRPFSLEDTMSYVSHRLQVAGAGRPIFDQGALEAVHQFTGGVPRKINRLCDLALLIGFAEELAGIGAEHISAVSEELVSVTAD